MADATNPRVPPNVPQYVPINQFPIAQPLIAVPKVQQQQVPLPKLPPQTIVVPAVPKAQQQYPQIPIVPLPKQTLPKPSVNIAPSVPIIQNPKIAQIPIVPTVPKALQIPSPNPQAKAFELLLNLSIYYELTGIVPNSGASGHWAVLKKKFNYFLQTLEVLWGKQNVQAHKSDLIMHGNMYFDGHIQTLDSKTEERIQYLQRIVQGEEARARVIIDAIFWFFMEDGDIIENMKVEAQHTDYILNNQVVIEAKAKITSDSDRVGIDSIVQ